ncbi:uncharacterized protein LOC115229051 [Octopus sinensis]|uniref:Uncharacterized protein LOC115229051 n=1 Tax=Octopus sinensis TaxID=2607531 RepID=A0A6P7TZH9_9MOLL|nr:uncharacterized protein LOC115229051 [Octopus sinensis]
MPARTVVFTSVSDWGVYVQDVARRIAVISGECKLEIDEDEYVDSFKTGLMEVTKAWAGGMSFSAICEMTDHFEGCVIRSLKSLEELLNDLIRVAKNMGCLEIEEKFQNYFLDQKPIHSFWQLPSKEQSDDKEKEFITSIDEYIEDSGSNSPKNSNSFPIDPIDSLKEKILLLQQLSEYVNQESSNSQPVNPPDNDITNSVYNQISELNDSNQNLKNDSNELNEHKMSRAPLHSQFEPKFSSKNKKMLPTIEKTALKNLDLIKVSNKNCNYKTDDIISEESKISNFCQSTDFLIHNLYFDGISQFLQNPNTLLFEIKSNWGGVISSFSSSFHVGSGCEDPKLYWHAIEASKFAFSEAMRIGYSPYLLDIGGGFPGADDSPVSFKLISEYINSGLATFFPGGDFPYLQVISEPGRFFVASAYTLVTRVVSVRQSSSKMMYYLNDGVYGAFNCVMYDHATLAPLCQRGLDFSKMYKCDLWGPTCDSIDCICEGVEMPLLSVDDLIVFKNMGAYTLVAASKFNGMNRAKCLYLNDAIIR